MRKETTFGINSPFDELSPTKGQVVHVLRTRLPLSSSPFVRRLLVINPARLACLSHAASVHSEPGSNSPLLESLSLIYIYKELLYIFRIYSEAE